MPKELAQILCARNDAPEYFFELRGVMNMWWEYKPYVSVAEKKAKAKKSLEKLKKTNSSVQPVVIEGNSIARTWWGKSWNGNLERYADYSNRIGRGRNYVKNGAVLDLHIEPGEVTALVQGTASKPYSVTISIRGIEKSVWDAITKTCQGRLDSLHELVEGKFPKDLGEIFMAKGQGLFPSPKEIEFSCSCPDWASMCKHVASVLYGIGARLDHDPMLFFKLRKANVNDLISQVVKDKTKKLLDTAEKKSRRVLEVADISDVFGIEIEEEIKPRIGSAAKIPAKADKIEHAGTKKEKPKPPAAEKKKASERMIPKTIPKPVAKKASKMTAPDTVFQVIRKSRNGTDIATIVRKTGFDEQKVYNAVHRLKKLGKIVSEEWGFYKAV